MLSGLGHRVVWYKVMNVLEEHSGSLFTGSWKMAAVCPDRNLGTHHTTQSQISEDYIDLGPVLCHTDYKSLNQTIT
jgi:hypothetical protein